MKFADPLVVGCPRCRAVSRHHSKDLLALAAACPVCGAPLDEIGLRMGADLDALYAGVAWVEVLVEVEERLGITGPGIADAEVLDSKPHRELTLRDLARLVAAHAPPGAETEEAATRVVLEAAADVAGREVPASDLDRPLPDALHRPRWADKHARIRAERDRGG